MRRRPADEWSHVKCQRTDGPAASKEQKAKWAERRAQICSTGLMPLRLQSEFEALYSIGRSHDRFLPSGSQLASRWDVKWSALIRSGR